MVYSSPLSVYLTLPAAALALVASLAAVPALALLADRIAARAAGRAPTPGGGAGQLLLGLGAAAGFGAMALLAHGEMLTMYAAVGLGLVSLPLVLVGGVLVGPQGWRAALRAVLARAPATVPPAARAVFAVALVECGWPLVATVRVVHAALTRSAPDVRLALEAVPLLVVWAVGRAAMVSGAVALLRRRYAGTLIYTAGVALTLGAGGAALARVAPRLVALGIQVAALVFAWRYVATGASPVPPADAGRDEESPVGGAASSLDAAPPSASTAAAGFWPRAAAISVDLLILKLAAIPLALLVWPVGMMLPLGSGALRLFGVVVTALQLVVPLFYFAGTECSGAQGTPGKRLLGLAVTGAGGERIGLERALARTAAKVLSALPLGLGFLAAAFTRDHRAAHDLVASTRVVQRRPAGVAGLVVGALAAAIVGGRVVAPLARRAAGALERRSRVEAAAAELEREFAAIHAGQLEYAHRTGRYLDFRLPATGIPNEHPRALSDEDLAIARELGWDVPERRTRSVFFATMGFGPGSASGAGPPTYSACAMSDADGDGKYALVVLWQPPVNAAGEVVGTPPPAPCPNVHPELLTRPLEVRPGDPIGVPVRVTPGDVR